MSNDERIDLNLFRVFEAIHRSGSLTQAAEALHLTQPAVSNALRRLRMKFDDPLFVREGRRVLPTPRAKAIAPEVSSALQVLQQTLKKPRTFPAGTSTRRFLLGMRDVLESVLLPQLMGHVLGEAPHVQVQSTGIERNRMERDLLSGTIDFAIDVSFPVSESIAHEKLFEEVPCVVVRRDHPLVRGRLNLKQWLSAKHVVVSTRRVGPVIEDHALQREGLQRDVAVRCQHYQAACQLVATSDLMLVLPRYFGEWFARTLPLQVMAMPLDVPKLQVMLYWSKMVEQDPGHAWLLQRLRKIRP
jgi:DNA-binding transcriptional LysR family regulator